MKLDPGKVEWVVRWKEMGIANAMIATSMKAEVSTCPRSAPMPPEQFFWNMLRVYV
jgi:hypothetical protein